MTAFHGARDYDDARAPGWLSDALCLLLALFNAAIWPTLFWLMIP